jgi:tetratricopeptide (TPR) repeat protein
MKFITFIVIITVLFSCVFTYGKDSRKEIDQKMIQEIINYLYQGDFKKADSVINNLIAINPSNYMSYFAIGLAYFMVKKNNETLYFLQKALIYNPKDTDRGIIFRTMGAVYFDTRQLNESIDHYQKSISYNQQDWLAYKGLGGAYSLKGTLLLKEGDNRSGCSFLGKAEDALKKAILLKPDDAKDKLLWEKTVPDIHNKLEAIYQLSKGFNCR